MSDFKINKYLRKPNRRVSRTVTSDTTLQNGDSGGVVIIDSSSSDVTVTIPSDTNESFADGTVIWLYRDGANFAILRGESGVTLNPDEGFIQSDKTEIYIRKQAANEWVVGDLGGYQTFIAATGGTVSDITVGGVDYRVHSFTTVGTSTFNVEFGGEVEVFAWGAGGAGDTSYWRSPAGNGGAGGFSRAYINAANSDSFTVVTGGGGSVAPQNTYSVSNTQPGGFGGGGWTKADGGGGGGLSGVFTSGSSLTFDSNGQSRALLIAGGGGGGADGVAAGAGVLDVGGAGGGLTGGTGETGQSGADGGTGGTQTQPGTNPRSSSGRTGQALHGAQTQSNVSTEGGAGGGGYFGGGSGYEISGPGGAGGGGSGYVDASITGETKGGGTTSTPPEINNFIYPGNNIGYGGPGDQDGYPGIVMIRYRI